MRLEVRSFPVWVACFWYRRKILENTVSFRKLLETSLSERVFTRPTYRKVIQFQGEFGLASSDQWSEIGPPHIWSNICAFPHILESPSSYIWLCNCSILNYLIYEENLIFFFFSMVRFRFRTKISRLWPIIKVSLMQPHPPYLTERLNSPVLPPTAR
jgi:hypothetical protein